MFKTDYLMFHVIQNGFTFNKEKNVILEPLSCIFRIILLNYKEDGIKISISNNAVTYSEASIYQGLLRKYNGDTREDLHNLYNPFLKAFEWYINDVEDSRYQYFYKECFKGLKKLLNSYEKGSIIHHTITHYCNMFKDRIDHKLVDIKDIEKESPLLNDLKDFWNEDELIIIHQILQYLEKCDDELEKNVYFNTIDNIITMKENKLYNYVEKYSSSYN